MRSLMLAGFAAVGSLMMSVPAAAVTIAFDPLQVGMINGTLDYPDASFSSDSGRLYIGAAGGDQAICALSGSHCVGALTVTFANPVDNLSFLADGDNLATSSVFVTGMASTGAFSFTGTGFDGNLRTFTTIDLSAFSGITSISLTSDDPAGLGFDVFTFDALSGSGSGSTVPEPAAWLLMVAGFGLVGSSMRRRVPLATVAA